MSAPLITIIEDDPFTLDMLTDLFTDEGFRVSLCERSRDAIAHLYEETPALIILDLRLETPRSGWELLHTIRHNSSFMHIPIILCTTDAQFLGENETAITDYQATALHKPFDIDKLVDLVHSLLR